MCHRPDIPDAYSNNHRVKEYKEMKTNTLNKWWQGYRESNRSNKLHHELMILLHGQSDTAQRLIDLEKIKHPGQPESWYLDKVVYDLKREA